MVPFYFGGNDGTSSYTLIPPLLFYRGVSPGGSTTWVGNTIYTSRPDGFSLSVLPLLFVNRSGGLCTSPSCRRSSSSGATHRARR